MKHLVKFEFQAYIRSTDSPEIVQRALEICREYPYRSIKPQMKGDKTWTAFYSEADLKERKLRKGKDYVEVGELFNEYHIYRFEQAIDLARTLFRESQSPTNRFI